MIVEEKFSLLKENYLFSEIAERVRFYERKNNTKVISMGIGDVTLPIPKPITDEMQKAVEELSTLQGFHGYPPTRGREFLLNSIAEDYRTRGVEISPDEIFVSDGAKTDCSGLTDLFSSSATVSVPNPVYPVYLDRNLLSGRKITYLTGTEENGFLPMPDEKTGEIIYLCSPNNPTGTAYGKTQLQTFVDYANANGKVILYDRAYEGFISDGSPTSIYQTDGAKNCAIEISSFSKTAGFTGIRCGYTVVPKELNRDGQNLNKLWFRRQSAFFNGVSYITERGANAVFSNEGSIAVKKNIAYYKENVRLVADVLKRKNMRIYGETNSPYIWMKCPNGLTDGEFFDMLLKKADVVCTPGSGFGDGGKGYVRFSCFGIRENIEKAVERLDKIL